MKYFISILLLLVALDASAPDRVIFTIFEKEKEINIYENLIRAVVLIESKGDTMAYNKMEEAYGAFQIRPIRLLDYNQRTGKKYRLEDCFNYRISREIFLYYALRTSPNDYETISRNWNGSGVRTIEYWQKVSALLSSIN